MQSLVATKTLQRIGIQGTIYHGLPGTGIPHTRCVSPHRIHRAWKNNSETREKLFFL